MHRIMALIAHTIDYGNFDHSGKYMLFGYLSGYDNSQSSLFVLLKSEGRVAYCWPDESVLLQK